MEIKFTPWRMTYIKSADAPRNGECVLCRCGSQAPSMDNLVLHRGQHSYVIMNLYPYNTAHLMVTPYAHTADLAGLPSDTATEVFELTRWAVALIAQEYQPVGFNIGMNLGRTAGAGIADHLHMHIVPRWNGDNNFMPIIGGEKLIPETLDVTYQRLWPLFQHGREGAS